MSKYKMHCDTQLFTVASLYTERNSIEENPSYQRESAIWSPAKQELFIDSMINNYDIPKIYFHDLRPEKKLKRYSIIDGKQRLHTIYQFLDNKFPLANDFKLNDDSEYTSVIKSAFFKDFSEIDREKFKSISLSIVLIKDATEDDIEDLFFRLNNGEPLNGAEKRNAKGWDMNKLIKEIASNPFFTKKLKFKNRRYSHYEIAAKFLLLEKTDIDTNEIFADLKKIYLDRMVDNNKKMTQAAMDGLKKRVDSTISLLNKVFSDNDDLLTKQAYPPLYYLFIKLMRLEYGHSKINTYLHEFIGQFQVKRLQNLSLPDDNRDSVLIEFGRLMQQGTNDISSLKERVSILRRYFLQDYPDVKLLDDKRQFSEEERYAIYILSGNQCAECARKLKDIKEMEADHNEQWAFGGETTLNNARALCIECNQKLKKKIN